MRGSLRSLSVGLALLSLGVLRLSAAEETPVIAQPAITNLATATNDLALLRQQLVKIDDEIKQVLARQTPLKPVMSQDYRTMTTFPTDYVPQDDEGKKIKARMTEVETELKDLRGRLEAKMVEDPAYKELKSKVDTHKAEWIAIDKRKNELRQERSEVGGKIWQLQKLTEEAEKAAKAKEQEAGTGKSTP